MNFEKAKTLQITLSKQTILSGNPDPGKVKWILGVDASISADNNFMIGAAALFHWPLLKLDSVYSSELPADFPYVAGFLSFRELPVLLKTISKLHVKPDLIIVDGQGFAHPRRFGLACHLGVKTGYPTIGCAKSRLLGDYHHLALSKGSYARLSSNQEKIGHVVRTRTGVSPVWISPGHRIGFTEAVHWILRTVSSFRLPDPVRAAHQAASEHRCLLQENFHASQPGRKHHKRTC